MLLNCFKALLEFFKYIKFGLKFSNKKNRKKFESYSNISLLFGFSFVSSTAITVPSAPLPIFFKNLKRLAIRTVFAFGLKYFNRKLNRKFIKNKYFNFYYRHHTFYIFSYFVKVISRPSI